MAAWARANVNPMHFYTLQEISRCDNLRELSLMEGELLQTREDSHGLGRLFENDAAETTRYSLLKQLILKDFFDSSCELR
jgi:hypothetical protein